MKRIFFDQERCLACRSCLLACWLKHSRTKYLPEAILEKPGPVPRIRVTRQADKSLVLQCRQCPEPYCLSACISGAITRKDEVPVINRDRCVHCYSCLMVCPYGVIAMDRENPVAVKCELCQDEEVPPCVSSCPTKALFFGQASEFEEVKKKRRSRCIT
ncbi:MAG TPA: 4Fe-4S binding protein [bacterium]|nr:4Fe-4S binding protein [bacterium]HOL67439.1 4Fe-4S binding protein [bacterium]